MGKIKIYENPDEFIELSEESAELMLMKNITSSDKTDYAQFIFSNFNGNWLKTTEFKKIFNSAKAFWNKYEKIPSKNVFTEFFKNKSFEDVSDTIDNSFNKILKFDTSSYDEKFIKNTIITYIKNKSIFFAIYDKVNDIENKGEIGDLLERFEKIIQIDLSEDDGIEYFENLENHCNELLKVNARTPFGLTELDHWTYGGLPTNDTCLFVVMAQPGMGKSQFMISVAYNWIMQNKKVLILTLEMSEDMYSRRFDALFANMNFNRLKDDVETLKKRVKGVKLGVPKSKLQIKEFPTGTLSSAMLKQYLKKLKASKNFVPDIIFVDYLNIMRPNSCGINSSLYEKCGSIAKELRAISSEYKIPVFTGVQANRCLALDTKVIERSKGEINISDLKEGDFILSNNNKFNEVKKVYSIIDRLCYKITTESGNNVLCSCDHPWPTEFGMKTISDGLKEGDNLTTLNKYDKIISIEKYKIIKTIDIEIDGNHLFFANNLLTHNCGAGGGYAGENIDMSNVSESSEITATADALMALYRLDGDRDNERINLKILKNRLGGAVETIIPLKFSNETLLISDWNSDTSANDEILDGAKDASEQIYNKKEKITSKVEDSSLEDI